MDRGTANLALKEAVVLLIMLTTVILLAFEQCNSDTFRDHFPPLSYCPSIIVQILTQLLSRIIFGPPFLALGQRRYTGGVVMDRLLVPL